MVNVNLNPAWEERFRSLAVTRGQSAEDLARDILEDYLDALDWPTDAPEAWAEASIVPAPEVLRLEDWDNPETENGPR